MLESEILTLLNKIREYNCLNPKSVEYEIKSGIDTLESVSVTVYDFKEFV